MWIVIKYKVLQFNLFKNSLKNLLKEEPIFYFPKIRTTRYTKGNIKFSEKSLLNDYIFCFNYKFADETFTRKINFLKGVKYYLNNFNSSQKEIIDFIEFCKKYEKNGFITNNFFKKNLIKNGRFISGPFTNFIFEIFSRNEKELKTNIGKFKLTISANSVNNYLPA